MYEPPLYRSNDGSGALFSCRFEFDCASASGHPLSDIHEPLKFAAMVPLQVYNTLQVLEEKERLKQTDILIIGGGAVDVGLEADIQSLPGAVYSTYGMTETLSHICSSPSERSCGFRTLSSFLFGAFVFVSRKYFSD